MTTRTACSISLIAALSISATALAEEGMWTFDNPLVGLVFDTNIESLAGNYVYDGEANRTVAVHTAAMTEALRKLYHADRLVNELMPEN